MRLAKIIIVTLMVSLATATQAAEMLKPFVLAEKTQGDLESVSAAVIEKMSAAGFEVVGQYSPYDGARIIGITSDALRQAAAKSEYGGYGAVQRIALTKVGADVQVAYTHPTYMANAYRMTDDLAGATKKLGDVLGNNGAFGPEEGLPAEDLREYHYMFGMPYFDDPLKLASHDSYEAAVKAVEEKLAAGTGGVTKVWRVDLPGKKETVFGVGMKAQQGGNKYMDDSYVMSEIDFKTIRSTAHLPYEMLVSGSSVYALPAEFRIAINFPDLAMVGKNSFMNIMQTPDAVRKVLEQVAGAKTYSQYAWD